MKTKWLRVVISGIILLLAFSLASCTSTPATAPDIPSLTSEQVISRVQVYGVSTLERRWGTTTYKNAAPVGQWSAVYEGNGQWRVQGSVVFNIYQVDYYYTTTWLHKNTELKCISMVNK